MRRIEHLGIVGASQLAEALGTLAEAAGYRVCYVDPEFDKADVRTVKELNFRLDAACFCLSSASELYRVAAEYLHLDPELRPVRLVNMTTIGPGHARRIDALLGCLEPDANFAECPLMADLPTLHRYEGTILYGSRSGPPDSALTQLLHTFAARVIDLGDVATASAAKLVSNVAAISIGLATLEAFELGRKSGLPPELLFEVLANGPGDSYILHKSIAPVLLGGDLRAGFQAGLARQNVRLALALAGDSGLRVAYAALAAQLLDDVPSGSDLTFVAEIASDALLPRSNRDVEGPPR